MDHYKNIEDTYEYFSIVQTPMGTGGISGHAQGQAPPPPPPPVMQQQPQSPPQPPMRPPPIPRQQVRMQPAPPQRQLPPQQAAPVQERSLRHHDRGDDYYRRHRPYIRDRVRHYYHYPSPYYYYYPYYHYYPQMETADKCFCQDTNLLGAIPDKMVCGQRGCGVCIDRYLCNNCNDSVLCKKYY